MKSLEKVLQMVNAKIEALEKELTQEERFRQQVIKQLLREA